MALVIGGNKIEVPGLKSGDFITNKNYAISHDDCRPRRTNWIRSIVIHTRMGIWPQLTIVGTKSVGWDEVAARRWRDDERIASAHIAIDADGSFVCMADLLETATYHAGVCNEYTIGIEMYQDAEGRVYTHTMDATIKICDVITRALGIQRQFAEERGICRRFASAFKGSTRSQQLGYMPGGQMARNFIGVWGHRNCTRNRGPGDPGDHVWDLFRAAGYEAFSAEAEEDLECWGMRQAELGFREEEQDGIAGPRTVAALKAKGYRHGLWIARPGD